MHCPTCRTDLTSVLKKVRMEPITKLDKDARKAVEGNLAALALGEGQDLPAASFERNTSVAKTLVDLYYNAQRSRIRLNNQVKAVQRGTDQTSGVEFLSFFLKQQQAVEENAKAWLEAYAVTHKLWPWFEAVYGIGPVIAAGLVAHLGNKPVPNFVGAWWRYAGLDPTQKWLSQDALRKVWTEVVPRGTDLDEAAIIMSAHIGRSPNSVIRDATTNFKTGETHALTKPKLLAALARIPYNRALKTLVWKLTDSFVKHQDDASVYTRLYRERKAYEIRRNQSGGRADDCAKVLAKFPNHAQRKTYESGLYPDGHIQNLTLRWLGKIFLSHLHYIWHSVDYGRPPVMPYAITYLEHEDFIAPPHLEVLGLPPAARPKPAFGQAQTNEM